MKKLSLILLALLIAAIGSATISLLLGRVLMLSSRDEVVRLGLILFSISAAICVTLILAIRSNR